MRIKVVPTDNPALDYADGAGGGFGRLSPRVVVVRGWLKSAARPPAQEPSTNSPAVPGDRTIDGYRRTTDCRHS